MPDVKIDATNMPSTILFAALDDIVADFKKIITESNDNPPDKRAAVILTRMQEDAEVKNMQCGRDTSIVELLFIHLNRVIVNSSNLSNEKKADILLGMAGTLLQQTGKIGINKDDKEAKRVLSTMNLFLSILLQNFEE